MFVITADQVSSRRQADRAGEMIARLERSHGDALLLPADQTAGDEIQLLTDSAETALAIVLDATRDGGWSVGLGIGGVRTPLPDAARKASGTAFIAAREAVQAAKRSDGRFALRAASAPHDAADVAAEPSGAPEPVIDAAGLEALVRMLVLLRERRSDPGWEVVDLARTGLRQKDIAVELAISTAAVSARLKAAMWRAEADAVPPLEQLLAAVDTAVALLEPSGTGDTR
ncbi:DNA-binding protein [Agromyces allii]|uniref:DNA-binding protein n=1 Tax=Agromyces allii TaxID=393607 RepID=A0ABN2Q7V5_9MICO|nr:DNA-binding protein [Agromyces allii]